MLCSYVYLDPFLEAQSTYEYRDWAMDCGAFSAHNLGIDIDLQEYINLCKRLSETDLTLTEVFALDVIGDHGASLANTEEMWRQGVNAIPCFHCGEPWEALIHMAKTYPKIALGGLVGQPPKQRDKWIGQCFARVWPKKIHGFGLSGEKTLMEFPFHSVDSNNWKLGPCVFGRWNAFGGYLQAKSKDCEPNLRIEVEWYLDLEYRVRVRWRKEMETLFRLNEPGTPVIPAHQTPSIRLVYSTNSGARCLVPERK